MGRKTAAKVGCWCAAGCISDGASAGGAGVSGGDKDGLGAGAWDSVLRVFLLKFSRD